MEEQKPNSDMKQTVFLILLIIAICCLIWATLTVIKYKDIIKNPVGSNLKEFNIKTCTCIDSKGKTVIIDAVGYNSTLNQELWSLKP